MLTVLPRGHFLAEESSSNLSPDINFSKAPVGKIISLRFIFLMLPWFWKYINKFKTKISQLPWWWFSLGSTLTSRSASEVKNGSGGTKDSLNRRLHKRICHLHYAKLDLDEHNRTFHFLVKSPCYVDDEIRELAGEVKRHLAAVQAGVPRYEDGNNAHLN